MFGVYYIYFSKFSVHRNMWRPAKNKIKNFLLHKMCGNPGFNERTRSSIEGDAL